MPEKLPTLKDSQNMLTKKDLEEADFYTVFKAGDGVECDPDMLHEGWGAFSGAEPSHRVLARVSDLPSPLMHIERDDDYCEEHNPGFDDVDAALCALYLGFTLIKLPDAPESKYWRMYLMAAEENMKKLTLNLTQEEYEKLQALADVRRMSPANCLRSFIQNCQPGGSGWQHPATAGTEKNVDGN